MALPILELPIHIITLPISKQKVEFRPFVIKEEKSFLTSINTDKKEDILRMFNILIENSIVSKDFDIKKLNIIDFFYLILNIRMKSTGEDISGQLHCHHCNKKTDFTANLEESMLIENQENVKILIKVNENLSLSVGPPRINVLFETEDSNVIDILASSILTVIYDEKVYTDFSIEEVKNNILQNLPKVSLEGISEKMEGLAKMKLKIKFICNNCTKESEFVTDNIMDFL
jgi:hypothetical protein